MRRASTFLWCFGIAGAVALCSVAQRGFEVRGGDYRLWFEADSFLVCTRSRSGPWRCDD